MDLLNKIGLASPQPHQIFIKKTLIVPDENTSLYDSQRSLTEIFTSFLQGGTKSENIFRAKELHESLLSRLSKLREPVNYINEVELKIFQEALTKLENLVAKRTDKNKSILNSQDAQTIMELIEKIEFCEQEKEKQRLNQFKIKSHMNDVVDGIADKIMLILIRESMDRGSYIYLALAVARLNPIWEIPDETSISEYLKKKVLTDEFKQCLIQSIKGEKINKDKLNTLQKQFFYFANSITHILLYMPKFAIKWLPRTGKVTRLSLGIISRIPLFGRLFISFFGPVDDVISIIKGHEKAILYLQQIAKEAKKQNKLAAKLHTSLREGSERADEAI